MAVKIKTMTHRDLDDFERQQANIFKGARYGCIRHIEASWLQAFDDALAAKDEEAIQKCITERPYLASYVTPNTGHHGVWLYPKQAIGMKSLSGIAGKIPDFLVVAANSDGYSWWILELKRAEINFANEKGDALTPMANKALIQSAGYLAQFDRYLSALASILELQHLSRPKNVILLIGDSRNENAAQTTARSNVNHSLSGNLQVISYDRIRRRLEQDIAHFGKLRSRKTR